MPDWGVVVVVLRPELPNPLVLRELKPEPLREEVDGAVVPRLEKPDLELVPCRLRPDVPRDEDLPDELMPRFVVDRLEIPDRPAEVRPREVEVREPMLPRERDEIPLLRPLERDPLLRPTELRPEDPRELEPRADERLPPEREPPTEPPLERPETPDLELPPLWAALSEAMISGVEAAMRTARTIPLKACFVNIFDSPGWALSVRMIALNLNYKRKARTNTRQEIEPGGLKCEGDSPIVIDWV